MSRKGPVAAAAGHSRDWDRRLEGAMTVRKGHGGQGIFEKECTAFMLEAGRAGVLRADYLDR